MTNPITIANRLNVGLDYFTDVVSAKINADKFGCISCDCSSIEDLFIILTELEDRVTRNIFDEITEDLYVAMELWIPGNLTVVQEPQPPAPIDPITNDANNTFTFTYNIITPAAPVEIGYNDIINTMTFRL